MAINPGQIGTHPRMHNEVAATKGGPGCRSRVPRDTPGTDLPMCWKEDRQEIESHLRALEMCSHSPEEILWLPTQMLLKC